VEEGTPEGVQFPAVSQADPVGAALKRDCPSTFLPQITMKIQHIRIAFEAFRCEAEIFEKVEVRIISRVVFINETLGVQTKNPPALLRDRY